jgi:elongation factor Ts
MPLYPLNRNLGEIQMVEITAAAISKLRQSTGAGMLDCKKALTEAGADFETAVDWLRKKGLAAAAKKSGRVASEGLVAIAVGNNKAVVIELNSETDFVAKNNQFQELARNIAVVALATGGGDVEKLKAAKYQASSHDVATEIANLVGVIGENMQLRRTAEITGDLIVPYIHNSAGENIGKVAVLVAMQTAGNKEKAAEFGKQVAMHIAAIKPESLDVSDLDPTLVAREKEILSEQARSSGKPEAVIEKMIEGRIRKFYSEVVLLEQAFVMDGKTPVKDALREAEKQIGGTTKITGYVRFTLGEGVDKKEEDFASEVAKVASGS